MDNQQQELTPKQTRAIAALLSHSTITAAATASAVNRATLHRWLQDIRFRQELENAADGVLQELAVALMSIGGKAINRVEALIDSADESIALRASVAVLDNLMRLREMASLTNRVAALEQGGADREY